jgi:large subunit ribosomal protein L18
MKKLVEKQRRLRKRKMRVRKKISGHDTRPRLSIFKSNRNIYAQVIDDVKGHTLASVSTQAEEFKNLKMNVEDAAKLGEALGGKLKELKIEEVVFDRNGMLYHGVIKAFADGARKAGLRF